MKDTQRWQDWTNLVLGAWLVLAPLFGVGSPSDAAAWNAYIGGGVVALVSIWALARPQERWDEWLNLALGLWLIAAPFALAFQTQPGPAWNQIVVGLVVGIDALWVILQRPTVSHHHG